MKDEKKKVKEIAASICFPIGEMDSFDLPFHRSQGSDIRLSGNRVFLE